MVIVRASALCLTAAIGAVNYEDSLFSAATLSRRTPQDLAKFSQRSRWMLTVRATAQMLAFSGR